MADNLDALGDLATGAAFARAVEPHAGEPGDAHSGKCLNCGADLSGAFCSACGQKAVVHRSLGEFWHDLTHSVFHFDGKIWRTLPLLFWRPGDLTRRYVHGERARFVSPFALFLFSIFLMVAIFNSGAGPSTSGLDVAANPQDAAEALAEDQAMLRGELAKLEKLETAAKGAAPAWIAVEKARTQAKLQAISQLEGRPIMTRALAERRVAVQQRQAEIELARLSAQRAEAVRTGQPTAKIDEDIEALKVGTRFLQGATRSLGPGGIQADELKVDLGIEPLNALVRHAAENPQLALYKVQSNAYKFSWALIPLSVPFVWLLFFWRRDLHLFDHAVFVTYSIAFMTLLTTLCVIAIQFPQTQGVGAAALILYPPFHMYRQLRGAYQLGRKGALVRTALLAGFSVAALTLFAMLIVMLGLS